VKRRQDGTTAKPKGKRRRSQDKKPAGKAAKAGSWFQNGSQNADSPAAKKYKPQEASSMAVTNFGGEEVIYGYDESRSS
jgi:hypothetical protein